MANVIQKGDYTVYGMFCSYFTKKLETYLNVKGIPYKFVELDAPGFAQVAEEVGVMQIPLLKAPDGTWLCDTTPIIQEFEDDPDHIALRPTDPLTAFFSYFLEDCFDEWLWTPALYYRWAFRMDEIRRSEEFTYTITANGYKLPRFLLRKVIEKRQHDVHVKDNGITTTAHKRWAEELYIDLLDLLQPILKKRPFLFGQRPCEADIGLHGPVFPHFANDPTSQEIMQDRAPHVYRWVARLWSTRPEELADTPVNDHVPEDLQPLIAKFASAYLPYLVANRGAFQAGDERCRYHLDGLDWEVATAPYRVYCLAQLQQRYQALSETEKAKASRFLSEADVGILSGEVFCPPEMANITPANPARPKGAKVVSRHWANNKMVRDYINNPKFKKPTSRKPEKKGEGAGWLPIYFRHHRAKP